MNAQEAKRFALHLGALVCLFLLALPTSGAAGDNPRDPVPKSQQDNPSDDQSDDQSDNQGDEEEEEAVREKRQQMQRLAPVLRPLAPWGQFEVGASFYDTRREVINPRLNVSLFGGYRWEAVGVLAGLEVDRSWDFTQETDTLTLVHMGLGGELLYALGHARTTLIGGMSVLAQDTDLDSAGTVGWFIDLRPISVRWGMGKKAAVELTPVGLDLAVPVTDGIPLVLVSFMTRLGIEWSLR